MLMKTRCGQPNLSLTVWNQFREGHIVPSGPVFIAALFACAELGSVFIGEKIHRELKALGLHSEVGIQKALIHMYVNCADLAKAQQIFELMCQCNSQMLLFGPH